MKAMIFAAGLGTRLKPFTDNAPKALAKVNGKTLLEKSILYLQQYGITDVIVNVHHFPDMIERVITDNKGFGSTISISEERAQVLETGGGLQNVAWYFGKTDPFVVMNVDVLTNLALDKLITDHNNSDALATLAIMKRNSSRELLFDKKMNLCGWRNNATGEEKEARIAQDTSGYAFSGIQVVSPAIFDHSPFGGKFSLIDLYLHVARGKAIKGYDHTGDVFIDVGKPDSLQKAVELGL